VEAAPNPNGGDIEEPTEVDVTADVPEHVRGGIYSNFAQVGHDSDGFTLDFWSVDPGSPPERAILQARLRLSHRMAIRLSKALAENVTRWASRELEAREAEEQDLKVLAREADSEGMGEADG